MRWAFLSTTSIRQSRRHFQLTVPQVLFFLIWQAFRKEDTEDQTQSETVNESEDASSVESSESESASDEAAASEEASNKETLTQTENEETESESAEK